jgi:outer membrane protein
MPWRMAYVAAAIAICLPSRAIADVKVGYVNIQRALDELEEGKAAKARLQALLEAKQKDLDKERDALRKEKEQLDKQAGLMSEEVRLQRQNELQQRLLELAQRWEKGTAELTNKEQGELQAIFTKLYPIIEQIAQQEGLTMVFNKTAAMVYGGPRLDYTNEMIRLYREKYPSKAGAGKPVVNNAAGDGTSQGSKTAAPKKGAKK